MVKERIPCIFYLYIHTKLAERSTNSSLTYKEAVSYLHEWRIPKHIRIIIIKELELLGLIKRINRDFIELKRPDINLDNISELYSLVGLLSLEDSHEHL